jgi:uncharacterized membrane protein YeiH
VNNVATLRPYLDLVAVFLGGLSGSLHAVRRGFSVTGLIALAVAAGLGGGILRDVLLQAVPVAFKEPWYLPTVLVAAAIGFFFGSMVSRFRKPIVLMDAVWLGLYAVVGSQKAMNFGLSGFSAILLGVVTAVGGSVLVDLLAGERPELVQPGPIGHFGAVIGAVVYVVMARWLSVPSLIAMIVTVVLVFAVRVAALRFGIQVPTALDIPETISRVRTRPRKRGPRRLRRAGDKAGAEDAEVDQGGDQPV